MGFERMFLYDAEEFEVNVEYIRLHGKPLEGVGQGERGWGENSFILFTSISSNPFCPLFCSLTTCRQPNSVDKIIYGHKSLLMGIFRGSLCQALGSWRRSKERVSERKTAVFPLPSLARSFDRLHRLCLGIV